METRRLAFEITGQAVPWMPISVSPQATLLVLLSLIPPLAVFLGAVQLSYRERRWLSLVLIGVGIVSVFLGLIQVAQGPASGLRFFEFTNPSEAVGFFANRNHFAALHLLRDPFCRGLDNSSGHRCRDEAVSVAV